MSSLNQFQDNIKVDGGKEIQAFRMDNTKKSKGIPDMRAFVGLGSCHCCDRFFVDGNRVFIVEETRLSDTLKTLGERYRYLNAADKLDFFSTYIQRENYVKVYGTLVVLCRLAKQCKETENLIGNKKYNFWFVPELEDSESRIYFEKLEIHLSRDLQSLLKAVVDNVEIVPSSILARKYHTLQTTR